MKLGDKVRSTTNYIYDIWDPNCYLQTYAQVDDQMEGYIEEFLNQDETLLNFFGVSIVVDTEDFANGNFVLLKNLSKLHLITSNPSKIRQ